MRLPAHAAEALVDVPVKSRRSRGGEVRREPVAIAPRVRHDSGRNVAVGQTMDDVPIGARQRELPPGDVADALGDAKAWSEVGHEYTVPEVMVARHRDRVAGRPAGDVAEGGAVMATLITQELLDPYGVADHERDEDRGARDRRPPARREGGEEASGEEKPEGGAHHEVALEVQIGRLEQPECSR